VLITHEEEIASYAQRVIRLRDGQVVDDSADNCVNAKPAQVEVSE
jgi:ABC-type lipoprotein export system ATPase subunit